SQASGPGTGAASQGDYCCIRKDRSSSCLTLTMLSFERRRRRVELGPKALSHSRHSRSSSTPWKGKEDARLLLTRLNRVLTSCNRPCRYMTAQRRYFRYCRIT